MIEIDYMLKIENLNKSFGPTHANRNIHLNVKKGEVRGLAGENGSGKSTLASIIAGIHTKDSGEMVINGDLYNPHNPVDANNRKIGIVVQELGLVNSLPVGVNVFLGRTAQFSKYGVVSLKKINDAANALFKKWNLGKISVNRLAGDLSVENRKLVEIARALSIEPDILILDEVTQALSHDKRSVLYDIIEDYKKNGKSVLIITHDLEEMIKITDSITIMRDGEIVETLDSKDLTSDSLKRKMIGRDLKGEYYRSDEKEAYEDTVVMEVKNLSIDGSLDDISFDLHKGEILGICGLSDSGIHLLGKCIYGILKPTKGTICLKTENKNIKNCMEAIKNGIGYVPKDRDTEALMLKAAIKDNIVLPSIEEIKGRLGYISPTRINKIADEASTKYEVKSTGITQVIGRLSGGNKQKINISRWMRKNLNVVILDSPTRGVDVGVKAYIYDIMKNAKKNGLSMILISDELTEVIGMADRILVMKNGKIMRTINRSSHFTEDSIIEVMI